MPDNLTANLNGLIERKIEIAESLIKRGEYPASDRQDFRDAFVRDVYEAFNKSGWRENGADS